jgi:hypothetical protein
MNIPLDIPLERIIMIRKASFFFFFFGDFVYLSFTNSIICNNRATEYLLNNKQAKAGGYSAKFAHQRALMSAFTGLLCQPPSSSAE